MRVTFMSRSKIAQTRARLQAFEKELQNARSESEFMRTFETFLKTYSSISSFVSDGELLQRVFAQGHRFLKQELRIAGTAREQALDGRRLIPVHPRRWPRSLSIEEATEINNVFAIEAFHWLIRRRLESSLRCLQDWCLANLTVTLQEMFWKSPLRSSSSSAAT